MKHKYIRDSSSEQTDSGALLGVTLAEVKQILSVCQRHFNCLLTARHRHQNAARVVCKWNKRVTKHGGRAGGSRSEINIERGTDILKSCPPCAHKFHWCVDVKITVQILPRSLLYPSFTVGCFIFALSVMVKLKRMRQSCDERIVSS